MDLISNSSKGHSFIGKAGYNHDRNETMIYALKVLTKTLNYDYQPVGNKIKSRKK